MRPFIAIATLVLASFGSLDAQPAAALRIVVLEGEGGVNIIQQKTAVRPLVEVRDRNNVPVSGASVTFTIGGGQSTFAGGAPTLTVATNASGQAAAPGLNAVSSGAFRIQVSATFQGQAASASISMTNFATAAAAAAAGATAASAGGATAATAGGVAGGGGGISGATIGIVGAAVAGGAVVATQVAGKSDENSDGNNGPGFDVYNGTLSGQISVVSFIGGCTRTRTVNGTITIQMNTGNATGTARMQVNQPEISVTGNCLAGTTVSFAVVDAAVTGGPSALSFTSAQMIGAENAEVTFTGAVSGSTITGNIDLRMIGVSGGGGTGTTRMNVTLTR